jgi:hypothetical protein
MRRYAIALLAVLTLTWLSVALAAAPPDLSGNWKGNVAKSDFGPFPAPTSMTTKVEHKEPNLKSATTLSGDQGEMTMERTITTDGTETSYQYGPMNMKSKAKWEGATLVVDSKGSSDMGEFTMKEKWVLSEDGKTLNVDLTWSGAQGDVAQKLVYEKQ